MPPLADAGVPSWLDRLFDPATLAALAAFVTSVIAAFRQLVSEMKIDETKSAVDEAKTISAETKKDMTERVNTLTAKVDENTQLTAKIEERTSPK